jgi:hypothetical protein
MQNLAGVKEADKTILEELYLAGIPAIKVGENPRSEVPYTYVGKLGNWEFRRAWYYWIVKCDEPQNGLKLKEATELHYKKHPTDETQILGNIIRCGGHCGCPPPEEYGAQPIYDDELNEKLKALGCEEIEIQGKNMYLALLVECQNFAMKANLLLNATLILITLMTRLGLMSL